MGRTELREGLRWGHLTVAGFETVERKVEVSEGITEIYKSPQAIIKCDCGGEIRIWADDWRGTRALKDCGCGLGVRDGAKIVFTANIPIRIKTDIVNYQVREGIVSFSAAVTQLLDMGLQYDGLVKGGK